MWHKFNFLTIYIIFFSQNPVSTVTSLQLSSEPSASVVQTQKRSMDLHRHVNSANSSALLTVKRRAGERYKCCIVTSWMGATQVPLFFFLFYSTTLYPSSRLMESCFVGSARCHTAASCRRLRSRGRASFHPTPRP